MLTALELYGFKSFPDRTRFEFPPGITVVVGPNGSGKSNIVDAIKWVLGEQSAKSLRGKEMADVIFKGTSGTGGRRPSNTAEASIFLENTQRRLRLDADEIKITRRVFRSGEGEYLINGEPCRLKDIKNLIRGTGVGTDAYSLIEQGKVDQLLQASPKERRAIFEEAAGISRFKAKKIEAERRLARVEQNLVRLADIVEEVGNHYRKIKSQASKAAKFKEYTERLKALRTHVGAKDWRDFSHHLNKITDEKNQLEELLAKRQTDQNSLESQSRELDVKLSDWSTRILKFQDDLNHLIQDISQRQSNIALHQSRSDDLNVQSQQQRQSIEQSSNRLAQLETRLQQSTAQLESSEKKCSEAEVQLTKTEAQIAELESKLSAEQASIQTRREQHSSIALLISELGKQLSASNSQHKMTSQSADKLRIRCQDLDAMIAGKINERDKHNSVQQALQNQAAEKDSALQSARHQLQQIRDQLGELHKTMGEKRRAQTGATQRAEVIQELENRLEGVGSGVKELLEKAKSNPQGSLRDVIGLVADVIKVNVQHAELIDLALGEFAQGLIVDGDRLVQKIACGELKLAGRVRLIQLQNPPSLGAALNVDMKNQLGVVGRLDKLVQAPPEFQNFISKLLGGTWLVKTMHDALRLRAEHSESARFITLQGDVVEADETIVAGPRSAVSGIVSRRSELRELHRDIHQLSDEIRQHDALIDKLKNQEETFDNQVQTLLNENTEIGAKLSDERAMAKSVELNLTQLEQQRSESQTELAQLEEQIGSLHNELAAHRNSLAQNESQLGQLVSMLETGEKQVAGDKQMLGELNRGRTSWKVQLAKSEQHLQDARVNTRQLREQLQECQATVNSTRDQLARMLWQKRSSKREILHTTSLLSELEENRSVLDGELSSLTQQRTETDNQRRQIAQQLTQARSEIRNWKDKLHSIELKEKQLSLERQQLAERLRDDYDIDVAELEAESSEIDESRDAIDKEISDLRRSIGNIGSVNMDALVELEELQQRYESLDAQYQDLVNSKTALEKIIQKINNDSRRLFAETLDAIRINFQKLFRQTFGGGRADLVLEEGVDILEAGIDIMATPPGKPQFNNSLLSGGERALTAVSLLMAIFQFRPSPFCVLDEVDAPFDEANVGRFIDVLKSFLDWTKFVIVTHSKMTMTAATTLYGVTMQESGVSKRVSVKFEEVSEGGEISPQAHDRGPAGDEKVA